MLSESRELIEKYRQSFKRIPNYQYWLVIVDNHFNDRYYFFIYSRKLKTKLVRSHELLALVHDRHKYQQVLADLKKISHLSIEYRDTAHLVEPMPEITTDKIHGHNF
ncbi:hypothetical protein [Lentilactobacillus parakefiri]|uniref:Acetyl-CoA carboxylase n=1 Tax=Lentilactobacillus parakefiri TaxID=152332 RepID=A0A269YBP4_9LACO|nr:hypothetical protein [Lentilactobacillus parakefiri]KRL58123.1 hypothetical protein FD08_GL003728 [Lentilactobacillus parakefiri DSM 10551]PAK82952.1 hypothetical protein B8W98_07385 [Lentilactobacillus parakefiri]PAK99820.1 hypothetical protein B8W96_09700 [Lentilactobacillus parakefiri]TDG87908.1 hypothetical protein C5L28_001053 [Lentilactobacillus parakefiri]GAW71511.1 acetyl-CoA carboxylase [Lentilactobacillus parakefiri]